MSRFLLQPGCPQPGEPSRGSTVPSQRHLDLTDALATHLGTEVVQDEGTTADLHGLVVHDTFTRDISY